MLMFGKNITQANDPLHKFMISELFLKIEHPKPEIKAQIQQLQTIATIDQNKYRLLKTSLPYFTTGIFHPPYRKKEHFAWIQHFVLDIDHLDQKELTTDDLKNKISNDPHVLFAFNSPSGKGLKIICRLSEKCYDASKFSLFYKLFAQKFSEKYQLAQVIDNRTSDVTRACFISYDTNPLSNPTAADVEINTYIDFDNWQEVNEAKKLIKEAENQKTEPAEESHKTISPDIIQQIKAKLNPSIRTQKEKIIYVPEKLEEILETVKNKVAEYGIETREIVNIHYGKKFVFGLQQHWAEINVFYGKKGFSVVKTPKRGSSADLTEIAHKLLCELFI